MENNVSNRMVGYPTSRMKELDESSYVWVTKEERKLLAARRRRQRKANERMFNFLNWLRPLSLRTIAVVGIIIAIMVNAITARYIRAPFVITAGNVVAGVTVIASIIGLLLPTRIVNGGAL